MTGPRPVRTLVREALALSLGPAVGLGLARFGYAVLLPAMRTDLAWTYTEAGSMNTANAVGYLAGALVAAPLAQRFGVAAMFRQSILWAAASMVLSAATGTLGPLLLLRLVAGVAGAVALITGATLAARVAQGEGPENAALVIGLYFGGIGMGIAATGLGIPALLDADPALWRWVWLVMGVAAFGAYAPARAVSRRVEGVGPRPAGDAPRLGLVRWGMAPALVAYFLFGLGYITYMTFVVAFLGERAWGPWAIGAFWCVVGTSTFLSGFFWPRFFAHQRAGRGLATRLAVVALGSAVPLVSSSGVAVFVSAVLFGGAFLSVVSVITEVVRRGVPPSLWSAGIALFTVAFSAGQALGPVLSGFLADWTGRLGSGFEVSAAVLAAAALVGLLQPDPPAPEGVDPSAGPA